MTFRGQTLSARGSGDRCIVSSRLGEGWGLASGVRCQCMTGHGQVRSGLLGKKAWMSSGSPEGSLSILSVGRKIW